MSTVREARDHLSALSNLDLFALMQEPLNFLETIAKVSY